jgi:hypothetical protein
LIRSRAGESADFEVEACDAKGRLALPSNPVHGSGQKMGDAAPPAEALLVLIGRGKAARGAGCGCGRSGWLARWHAGDKAQAGARVHRQDAEPAVPTPALDRLASGCGATRRSSPPMPDGW